MTSQDIREMSFEKAVFGGYDMGAVDGYLETVSTEFAALQKENAALKGKLKVLVDKVEECRASEDAIRLAILSAQKASSQMIADAEAKRDGILAEVEDMRTRALAQVQTEQQELLSRLKREIAAEEKKLKAAKSNSAQFIETVRGFFAKQLQFFEQLGDLTPYISPEDKREIPVREPARFVPAEKENVDETVKAIEASVDRVTDLPAADIQVETSAPQEGAAENFEPTRQFSFIKDESGQNPKSQYSFDNFAFGD